MPSSHLDSIYGWRKLGEAYHYGPWAAHTVGRRRALDDHFLGAAQTIEIFRAWHAIIDHGYRILTNPIYLLDFPIVL